MRHDQQNLFFAIRVFLLIAGSLLGTSNAVAQDEAVIATAKISELPVDVTTTLPLPASLSPALLDVILNVSSHDASFLKVEQWTEEIRRRLKNTFGQAVQLHLKVTRSSYKKPSVVKKVALTPKNIAALNQTRVELSLKNNGREWEVRGRFWLAITDRWNNLTARNLKNSDAVPRALAETIVSCFRPTLQIKTVEQEHLTGVLLGGEFPVPDDSVQLIKPGDFLCVVMLYFDRDRQLKSRQVLPWTYLKVRQRNRAAITCDVISAFGSPIPKSRRRVEVMAYRIDSLDQKTDVNVLVRGNPNHPFQLTKVFLSSWELPKKTIESTLKDKKSRESKGEGEKQKALKRSVPQMALSTSRMGTLEFSREEIEKQLGRGLIKIEVMSDDAVVARVPWLPGSSSELELIVPDDAARRDARLKLEQLKTELLRVTAKRATLIAGLRKLADKAREIDPTSLFDEIKKIPSRSYFRKRINLIRVSATDELNQKGNRTAARDVKKMCEQAELLIDKHLSDEPIDELKLRLGYKEKQPEPPNVPEN